METTATSTPATIPTPVAAKPAPKAKGPSWLKAIAKGDAANAKAREAIPDNEAKVPMVVAMAKAKGKPAKGAKAGTPKPPKAHAKAKAGPKAAKRAKAHKPTKANGKARRGSCTEAAAVVMKGRKPMRIGEIYTAIKERRLWPTEGKTPQQTLSGAVQRSPLFKRAGKGLWALK